MEAKASGVTVKFDGQLVTISRKGLKEKLLHGGNSEIKIRLASISSVLYKDATLFSDGYIHFVTGTSRRRGALEGGILDGGLAALAAPKSDENRVTFDASQKKQFAKLKAKVEAALARL